MTKPKLKYHSQQVSYTSDMQLNHFIEDLQKLDGLEVRTINIEGDSNYGIDVYVTWYAEETEEDREQELIKKQQIQDMRRAQLEWLKKELGEA